MSLVDIHQLGSLVCDVQQHTQDPKLDGAPRPKRRTPAVGRLENEGDNMTAAPPGNTLGP